MGLEMSFLKGEWLDLDKKLLTYRIKIFSHVSYNALQLKKMD